MSPNPPARPPAGGAQGGRRRNARASALGLEFFRATLSLTLARCVLSCREGVQEASREEDGFFIKNGIVVVLRNHTIPSGTVI